MKINRHSKIIQLIQEQVIETQDELAEKLTEEGFNVTQATVSRDIRELRLTKITDNNGKQRYTIHHTNEAQLSDRLIRVLKDGFILADRGQNIIVIKTVSGLAMAVAAALDAIQYPEVLGSIAGDDTIICVTRTNDDAIEVIEKLNKIVKE